MKNNYKKIFISLGLFLIPFFALPNISYAADINASASRTSGVAPLGVHFNADLTASSETERSFHDLDYSWDFGDPTSGNWGTSGKPKNSDKGPVAAHVYETPGTFTAILTVRDQTGATIDSKTFVITADDPDIFYSGTKTTCISTGSDFTGCPTGANQINTNDLSVLSNYTDAGERVLLKRGDSWTLSSTIAFPNNYGPVTIGAFGDCVNADELGICSNGPVITSEVTFLNASYKRDWRVADISFNGVGVSAVFGGIDSRNILGTRLNVSGGATAVSGSVPVRTNDLEWREGLFSVSNRIIDVETMTWIGSEKLVMMGNIHESTTTTSHIIRVWQSYMGVFSHNRVAGALGGLHALKFHGPSAIPRSNGYMEIGTYAETGDSGLRYPTQFNVISNNTFGGGSAYTVTIGPQDLLSDERLSDIIFEKNRIVMEYGQNVPGYVLLYLASRYTSVRNNVFDGTGDLDEYTGININNGGLAWNNELLPEPNNGELIGIKIFNNTFYSSNAHTVESYCIRLWPIYVHGAVVMNNYASFPNATSVRSIFDPARLGTETIQSNNLYTDTPYFTDPNNSNPLLRDFRLTSNSTQAINQGYTVSLLDDFSGNPRVEPYDIGAFEYSSGDTTAPSSPSGLSVL